MTKSAGNKKEKAGLLSQMPHEKRRALIGELAELMLESPLHRGYLVNDIGAVFLPAIDCNQFRIYRTKERPIGFVTWAWLTKLTEKKYVQGDYNLRPEDWNAGKQGWIIDLIAPYGHMPQIARDLKYNIFPDQIGKTIRIDDSGKVRGIWKLHGVNRIGDAKGTTDNLDIPKLN